MRFECVALSPIRGPYPACWASQCRFDYVPVVSTDAYDPILAAHPSVSGPIASRRPGYPSRTKGASAELLVAVYRRVSTGR